MRRNLKILSLGLVAVLAFAAMSAASASASFPTFVATEGALPFTFTAEGNKGKLETVGKSTVTCESSTGSGEIVNSATEPVKNTTITFAGCTSATFGASCTTSGQATGVIKTNVLRGQVDFPRVRAGGTGVLLRLFPKEQTNGVWIFATFRCGGIFGVDVSVRTNGNLETGGVLGVLEPINTSTNEFTLSFKMSEPGVQEFTTFEAGVGCASTAAFLETKAGGGEWEQSGIEDLVEPNKIKLGEKQKGEIQAGEKCV